MVVHDRRTGANQRVNLGPGGVQGNADSDGAEISADGRFVAFQSVATNVVAGDMNAVSDVFVHDRGIGATRRVSVGPGAAQANDGSFLSFVPALSAEGRLVVFVSFATNLLPANADTNGY